jgi:hypothetical protein
MFAAPASAIITVVLLSVCLPGKSFSFFSPPGIFDLGIHDLGGLAERLPPSDDLKAAKRRARKILKIPSNE